MENWAEIRRLHLAEGLPIKAIARRLGIRETQCARRSPPASRDGISASRLVPSWMRVEPQIRLLLQEFPDMPSTVIMERVGWTRCKTVICDRIAALRRCTASTSSADRGRGEFGQQLFHQSPSFLHTAKVDEAVSTVWKRELDEVLQPAADNSRR